MLMWRFRVSRQNTSFIFASFLVYYFSVGGEFKNAFYYYSFES